MPHAQRSVLRDALCVRLAYLAFAIVADLLIPDYDTSGHIDTDKLSGADWLIQRVPPRAPANTEVLQTLRGFTHWDAVYFLRIAEVSPLSCQYQST